MKIETEKAINLLFAQLAYVYYESRRNRALITAYLQKNGEQELLTAFESSEDLTQEKIEEIVQQLFPFLEIESEDFSDALKSLLKRD